MEIKLIQDKKQWNDWAAVNGSSFTQSWEWGDILLAEGKRVERLAVIEGEEILAQAQVVYQPVIFGWQYVACPKGPAINLRFKNEDLRIYETITNYLKQKNIIFFRIEPDSINLKSKILILKSQDINPSATLILDLKKSEEEILAGMHQKTRYNIHLAEKKDLKISQEKTPEVFWDLMNKTGSRDRFSLHHKKHYEKVLESPMIFQMTAYFNNIPVAMAVFTKFGNTFTYLYGASDYEHRNLMAPYLLQWEGIKLGKSLGCERYDFFGVAPCLQSGPSVVIPAVSGNPDNSNVPWIPNQVGNDSYKYDLHHQYAGVTRFKLGFGGTPQQSAGTWDIIIDNKKYKLYNLLRRIRRLI